MRYQLPNYILNANLNSPEFSYTWYDPDPKRNFQTDYAKNIIQMVEPIGLRSKIALIIGVHEWVLGRFYQLTNSRLPFQMAEAAWCANIDVRYIPYSEFDGQEFTGPVEKALFYSMICLHNVIYVSDNIYDLEDLDNEEKDPEYYYSGNEWLVELEDIISLALHILSDQAPFKLWLEGVVKRLVNNYTQPKLDPFSNLFGQDNNASLLGDYVPREALDLSIDFDKQQTIPLLNKFLAGVDKSNPLLTPMESLKKKMPNPYYISE